MQEVLPKAGLVVSEKGNLTEILCKPKIMPLKSITLQKLEEMEVSLCKGHWSRLTAVHITEAMFFTRACLDSSDWYTVCRFQVHLCI